MVLETDSTQELALNAFQSDIAIENIYQQVNMAAIEIEGLLVRVAKLETEVKQLKSTEEYITNFVGMNANKAKTIILDQYSPYITTVRIIGPNGYGDMAVDKRRVTLSTDSSNIVKSVTAHGLEEINS